MKPFRYIAAAVMIGLAAFHAPPAAADINEASRLIATITKELHGRLYDCKVPKSSTHTTRKFTVLGDEITTSYQHNSPEYETHTNGSAQFRISEIGTSKYDREIIRISCRRDVKCIQRKEHGIGNGKPIDGSDSISSIDIESPASHHSLWGVMCTGNLILDAHMRDVADAFNRLGEMSSSIVAVAVKGGDSKVANSSETAPRTERASQNPAAKQPSTDAQKAPAGKQTSADEGVRKIQSVLAKCGFKPGPADGFWGNRTTAAAEAYIKAHGDVPGLGKILLMVQVDTHRTGDAGPCPSDKVAARADREENVAPETYKGPDYSGRDLSGQDGSNQDLTGADFTGSNVSDVNFRSATLVGANFEKAKAKAANFAGANLENIKARGADFRDAIMDKVNLKGADLRDALMDGVSLSGAALGGARFNASAALPLAQAAAVNWAKKITQAVQDKAIKDFKNVTDKLLLTRESDGSVRFPANLD